jgi:DNA-binding NtrC family response regulator
MPYRVLLVDDDRNITNAFVEILKDEGYEVQHAYEGAEALRLAMASPPPDLIVLDIKMPSPDGEEVLTTLMNRRVKTRIIVATGSCTSSDEIVGFMRAGACDFLEKPFQADDLLRKIKRAIAVESTVNLKVRNTRELAATLASRVQVLEQENQLLIKENRQLKSGAKLVLLRMLVLIAALAITMAFDSADAFEKSYAPAIFLIAIFVLVLLPFERVQSVRAGLVGSKAEILLNPKT